jgi:two-component system sensor histidine kinase GlrK
MPIGRPKSLSTLLTTSLLLVILPLLLAIGYGAIQLRQLSADSKVLVRDSVETARATQALFQHIAAMERAAGLYVLLEDPRLREAHQTAHLALLDTLDSLEARLESPAAMRQLATLRRDSAAIERLLDDPVEPSPDRVAAVRDGFDELQAAANGLGVATREATDKRLAELDARTATTQQWLIWALAALVPAALVLAIVFALFVVRPLRRIDGAISALGHGTFSKPIAIEGPSDLEALGRQLEWLRLRLLELAQEKNRFLRHMSHELKTPLANIREGTDLLAEGAVGPLDDNQREVAGILRDNALKLQRLIENLLSYSAWQTQTARLDPTVLRLPSLIGTVIDAQRLALAARDITLELDVDDVLIEADRGKLKLVLDNLISNSLKFTPRGGTIYVYGRRDGQFAVIDIADTGPGVPAADRDRIFEAFYSGSVPQTGPLKGTGIGLSIVQEFVHAHRGTVELCQGEYSGAHFRIRLPLESLTGKHTRRDHAA